MLSGLVILNVDPRMKTTDRTVQTLDEDQMSCLALGRTIAFLFYGLLAFMVVSGVMILGGEIGWWPELSDPLAFSVLGVVLFIMLVLNAKGLLPGTNREIDNPFSENHLAWGANVLSVFSLVVEIMWKTRITTHVVNGSFILCLFVFFVTKSVLSKRPRFKILCGMALPIGHFVYVAMIL